MSSSSASEEDALEYNMSEDLEDSPAVISPPPPSKPEKASKYKNRTRRHFPYNSDFQMFELKRALSPTRSTCPGPDGITYNMLRHLDGSSLLHLLRLFNRMWSEQLFPTKWHEAIVIPILKPGKDPKESTN
ncbi:hypothetical protein AVEN_197444-1 [Araneus ventricosus]|uniref:Reverse transcriptase domain-containing protein n=1 Tax=Araneus ventricosus TaxID=182803 RepID=A0A4Y2IBR4_ARAVE|nr:hypothetical protein AVEN_197444-1 [Araneus ventricosus]